MRSGEWYLGYYSYNHLPGAALHFGTQASGMYCLSEPEVKLAELEVGDQPLPGEDGNRLGRDYQRSASVTFELGVDAVDAPVDRHYPVPYWMIKDRRIGDWVDNEAYLNLLKKKGSSAEWVQDGVAMLRQVWRADPIRMRPTRVAWLVHNSAGRTRRLYGRPRKFDVVHSRFAARGYVPVICEFQAIDDRFYDEEEQVREMWDMSGFHIPWRPGRPWWGDALPPWMTQPVRKTVAIQHAGRIATQPVIEIKGPCTAPRIEFQNLWAVKLNMTIKQGESVEIDARPWSRTVLLTKHDGSQSSVADKLTRSSPRLADMTIPPGIWGAHLTYTRVDKRGPGPNVQIRWRNAHTWW
ncbi:hypothetical protein [Streptomyces sp. NRRL S-920]|uniref:hypothetical protein n=1 Tax=Streptomyces sp. NRRL S-920 TaxID=1463921 RepID=UPI0004C4DD91|nr:hypothetical protein [Streptomyces sp. NRRL S-920]